MANKTIDQLDAIASVASGDLIPVAASGTDTLNRATASQLATYVLGQSVVSTTTPSAGQIPVGNAGGTAYAPVSVSGDLTLASTGAATIANSAVTLAKIANASASSKLLGSGASGSGSAYAEITLGTGLSMSGTTLNSSASATPGGSTTQLQYNNAGAFAGMSGTEWDDTNRSLTLTGATVTTSNPVFNLTQTWNAGAVTFTGFKFNVTDTASAAASMLLDLQVGGSSKFQVTKGAGAFFSLNAVELRNSTSAQTFRVYNTYTDASNYERGFMRWASNVLEIGAEQAGTGGYRNLKLLGATTITHALNSGSFTVNSPYTNGSDSTVKLETSYPFSLICANQSYDAAVPSAYISAQAAYPTASTNISGGHLKIIGGAGASSSAGAATGGNIYLDGGRGYGTGVNGNVVVGATRGRLLLSTSTVAALPTGINGMRAHVTDSTVAAAGNFGATVAGGGSYSTPVYFDGTNWCIG